MFTASQDDEDLDLSSFLYEDKDDPFKLYLYDQPLNTYNDQKVVLERACPYATKNEQALVIQPRKTRDWYDLVTSREIHENPPRCLLFKLPKNPINLDEKGLTYWINQAKLHLPRETYCGCCIEHQKFACGLQPLCRRNVHRQATEIPKFLYDQLSHEAELIESLQEFLPEYNAKTIEMFREYARGHHPNNKKRPIPVTILCQKIDFSRSRMYELLSEFKTNHPQIYKAIESFRNTHLKESKAYEVGKYQR